MNGRTPINPSELTFSRGFNPTNIKVLLDKGSKFVAAFDGELNNNQVFNIREIYEEFGEWKPGKGVMVPASKKEEFLRNILEYCRDDAKISLV